MFMPFNEKYFLQNNKCHGNKCFGKLKKLPIHLIGYHGNTNDDFARNINIYHSIIYLLLNVIRVNEVFEI